MKLTVGIPTYNRSGFLREAIESVLAQTFTGFRVIVSDNVSDDDTPEVVRSFRDERIDYLRTERNIGPIANLNRLVTLAETEMLVLLPDDDVLKPGHLAAAVEALERFETAGLAHSACDLLDARSRVVGSMAPLPTRGAPVRLEQGEHALGRMMVSDWPICFSSVAYRTRAIIGAGGFRQDEEPFGDLQLWMVHGDRLGLRLPGEASCRIPGAPRDGHWRHRPAAGESRPTNARSVCFTSRSATSGASTS